MIGDKPNSPRRRTVLKAIGGSAVGVGLTASSGTAVAGVHPTSYDITIHYDSEANSEIECNNHCTMEEIAEYTASTTEGNFNQDVDYASANAVTEETTTTEVRDYCSSCGGHMGTFESYIQGNYSVGQQDVHVWLLDDSQWDSADRSEAYAGGAVNGLGSGHDPYAYVMAAMSNVDNEINRVAQHEQGHLFMYAGSDANGNTLAHHDVYNWDDYCNVSCMRPETLYFCSTLKTSWVDSKDFGPTMGDVISHGLKHDEVYPDGPDTIYRGKSCSEEDEENCN
jgi:hypothetical protein